MTQRFNRLRLVNILLSLAAAGRVGIDQRSLAEDPPPAATPGPHWSSDSTYYDFGEVWAGVPVVRPFEFKNSGTETLKILEARPKCSCSVAGEFAREIPPGQTGVIPFKLETTAKNGRVDESLTIKTNDPTNPDMVLRLVGRVKMICQVEVIHDDAIRDDSPKLMQIRATAANFGRVTRDQKLARLIRMKNLTGAPLSLEFLSLTPTESRFRAHFKETKPGEEYELTVRGDPPFPEGNSTAILTFKTNIPEFPTYRLNASAYVPPRVEVIPTKVVVDPDYPPVSTRIIRITNNGESPLEITAIASTDAENLHLSLMPRSPSKPTTSGVQLIIPQGYRPPDYGELIRINTTDKEMAVIEIPVLPDMYKDPQPRPADKPLKFFPGSMPAPPAGK